MVSHDSQSAKPHSREASIVAHVDDQCDRFEAAWRRGENPKLEDFLVGDQDPVHSDLLKELLLLELELQYRDGRRPDLNAYLDRFSQWKSLVEEAFRRHLFETEETVSRSSESSQNSQSPPLRSADATELYAEGSQASASAEDSSRSARLGDYELQEEIGRGGMGVVYKARQINLDRIVALKMIRSGQMATGEDIDRFHTEARSAALLQHSGIVAIHEVGQAGEQHYFSMDYVAGRDLSDLIAKNPLPGHEAAVYVEKIARAIDYAHAQGVLHRDLKPSNVLIDESDEPRITDFGLAKRIEGESDLTATGQILGTPSYMPPEQAMGQSKSVGPRSDVYSLGAILYALLAGHPPFRADSVAGTLMQVIEKPPVPLRILNTSIDRDLETVCLKCLEKDPDERYETAADLADDLRRYLDDEPVTARRVGPWARVVRRARRRPLVPALAAATTVIVLAATFYSLGAREDRQVAAILSDFEQRLGSTQWSESHLLDTETLLDQLAQSSDQQAAAARERLYDRYVSFTRGLIARPRLEEGDLPIIEEHISLLEDRRLAAVESLRKELETRLTRWDLNVELAPPFDNLEAILGPRKQYVTRDADRLIRTVDRSPFVVATKVSSSGNVEIEAQFEGNWKSKEGVGVVIDYRLNGGYTFLLRQIPAGVTTPSPGLADQAGLPAFQWKLEIRRQNSPLRVVTIPAKHFVSDHLTMRARKTGNRFSVWLNDSPPVIVEDLFGEGMSKSGVFGILWTPDTAIARLRFSQQLLPSNASPLEKGDDLFVKGHYAKALEQYRLLDTDDIDDKYRQELWYKQAECLLQIDDPEEAHKLLEKLFVEEGERWPLLAGCRLWALSLKQSQFEQADDFFHLLSARFRFEDLAVLLPEKVRETILERYNPGYAYTKTRNATDRVQSLERFLKIRSQLSPHYVNNLTLNKLLLSYWSAGDDAAVERVGKILVETHPDQRDDLFWSAYRDYCWYLRVEHSPEEARNAINLLIFKEIDVLDEMAAKGLLVERARIHMAYSQLDPQHKKYYADLAEKDLENLLQRMDPEELQRYRLPAAYLVLGYVRLERNDEAGALEAWNTGVDVCRRGGQGGDSQWKRVENFTGSGNYLVYYMMMASLTGRLEQSDALGFAASLNRWLPRGIAFLNSEEARRSLISDETLTAILRQSWGTQSSRDTTRRFALRQADPDTLFTSLPIPTVAALIRDGAFDGRPTKEQEDLLWTLTQDASDLYQSGKLGLVALTQAGTVWGGSTGLFDTSWSMLHKAFKGYRETRGPLSYVCGKRFLQLRPPQPGKAKMMFEAALQDTEQGTSLHQLTTMALEQLAEKEKP